MFKKIFFAILPALVSIAAPLAICALPAWADLNEVSIVSRVDAQKNANLHNLRGTQYYREMDYFAALKEFKIAIAINPNSQSTAVYYNNLGKVYLVFGEIQRSRHLTRQDADFSEMAKACFERAIMQDCMKFEYYKNLVDSYALLGITAQKKDFLLKNKDKNPFNEIIVAIILANEGKNAPAKALLQNFAANNPDLIITNDVQKFIKAL